MSSTVTATCFPSAKIELKWLHLVAFLYLVSCSSGPIQTDEFVTICDDESTLPQLSKDDFRRSPSKSESSPISRVVITVKAKSDPRKIAIEGGQADAKINEDQFWLWRMFVPRSGNAVTIFYSGTPDLIQVRYGRFLQARARGAGTHSGDGYAGLQRLRNADGSPHLLAVIRQVQSRLSETHSPFYKSWERGQSELMCFDP